MDSSSPVALTGPSAGVCSAPGIVGVITALDFEEGSAGLHQGLDIRRDQP